MSTIREVAKLANVSIATVSRVLNQDNTYKMTEDTRARVLDAVHELNYVLPTPSRKASTAHISKNSNLKIGCILRITKKGYNDPYYMSVLTGVEERLREAGITLSFIQAAPYFSTRDYLNTMFENPLDGLILMDPMNDFAFQSIQKLVPHIVGIDTLRNEIDDVGYDHLRGGLMATRHLIEKGHTRIGFIGGSGENETLKDSQRYQGYLIAMHQYGLPICDEWVIDCNWDEDECLKKTNLLCKQNFLPTAIFAASDLLAMASMKSLYLNGILVPTQMAVIGMSDIEMSQYSNPPLTTYHVPKEEIGKVAANLLLSRIEGWHTLPQKIILPIQFIERNST